MEYNVYDLLDELQVRAYESFDCMRDTEDYVPIQYLTAIEKDIFGIYKKKYKLIKKEEKRYQRALRKERRNERRAERKAKRAENRLLRKQKRKDHKLKRKELRKRIIAKIFRRKPKDTDRG